jgi:hypothetical protein
LDTGERRTTGAQGYASRVIPLDLLYLLLLGSFLGVGVVVLKSDAAGEKPKDQLSQDFFGLFDFRLLQ